MQLSSIDRRPVSPFGAEASSGAVHRVIPVAPVNPPTTGVDEASASTPSPGVIDKVNPALKSQPPNEGEVNYTSVPDPTRSSAVTPVASHDWTVRRPAPEKVETPPVKPLSQVLMEQIQTLWNVSASAVQVEQVKSAVVVPASQVPPTQQAGDLAKQSTVFIPSKITKTGSV